MIEIVIPFRNRSIGVMDVRRVLPFAKRRSVGPFVFVGDFDPVELLRDRSLDVLPSTPPFNRSPNFKHFGQPVADL